MSVVSRIFCSLEGTWKLSRIIPNQGSVEGIARFKKNPSYPDILFYREDGVFTLSDGNQYNISQEYEYRYSKEKISVYFARERDRLLHYLEFTEPNKASGIHLCGSDSYFATYEFKLPSERYARAQSRPFKDGLAELSVSSDPEERPPLTGEESPPFEGEVLQFELMYDVKGLKKNYRIKTVFEKSLQ